MIDIPPEYSGAVDTAWKRAKQLGYGMPLFMLNAMKPMIISIYMQGLVDATGYATKNLKPPLRIESERNEWLAI